MYNSDIIMRGFYNTFKTTTIFSALEENLTKIKKHNKPINYIKNCWHQMPAWAYNMTPEKIQNDTLFIKTTAMDALFLQYMEADIINNIKDLTKITILRIKLLK